MNDDSSYGITLEVYEPMQNESPKVPSINYSSYGFPVLPIPPFEVSLSSLMITIQKNQMYASIKELKRKLSIHAIKNNYEFGVKKSYTG